MAMRCHKLGNMDETPMNFDMPATHTVHPTGEKNIIMKTTGNENNHFTVVPACLANGSKLKPIDICKRKTMPKEPIPSQIVVHVREKGWMDQVGMKLWNEKVWRRREGGLLKKKSLLVYDMFKTHLMDSIFFLTTRSQYRCCYNARRPHKPVTTLRCITQQAL